MYIIFHHHASSKPMRSRRQSAPHNGHAQSLHLPSQYIRSLEDTSLVNNVTVLCVSSNLCRSKGQLTSDGPRRNIKKTEWTHTTTSETPTTISSGPSTHHLYSIFPVALRKPSIPIPKPVLKPPSSTKSPPGPKCHERYPQNPKTKPKSPASPPSTT